MRIEEFQSLVPGSRPCGNGYRGPCPACGGKQSSSKFSFTERGGKILVRCFAGCSITDLCSALGIEVKDLFIDSGLTTEQRRALPARPKRVDWRRYSNALEFASEHHWLRAEAIFRAANKIDPSAMDDDDMRAAWECLAVGFHELRISENLRRVVFQIRAKGLEGEAQQQRARTEAAA